LTNWDSLSHSRPVWCLPAAPLRQLQSVFVFAHTWLWIKFRWSQQRASHPAAVVKGDASVVHHNPCRGLTGSMWLRTGDVWCENLGNVSFWPLKYYTAHRLDRMLGLWLALISRLAMWAKTESSGYLSCSRLWVATSFGPSDGRLRHRWRVCSTGVLRVRTKEPLLEPMLSGFRLLSTGISPWYP